MFRCVGTDIVLCTLLFFSIAVGYITCVMGLCQMIVAFPTGYFADRYRRDKILQSSSFAGMIAISATLLAIYKSSYHYMTFALATWGIAGGMFNPSLSAIFADSVPDGKRSQYFTQRAILTTLGNVTGPLVALFMFLFLGDKWTIRDCAIVMAFGQVISLPAMLMLCCFKDHEAPSFGGTSSHADVDNASLQQSLLLDEATADSEAIETDLSAEITTGQGENLHHDASRCRCIASNRMTPSLIAMADVTAGLASGMSIRYFAVFLYDNLGLSPAIVQSLYVVTPLLQASLMQLARRLSLSFGRCHVTACFKWTGITLMICVVISYVKGFPTWLVCLLIVFRTAFMNSTSALTKSVLMDAVPRDERAKWSSLESLNMFSWSGSAALGGFLVAYEGILFNFCVTAFLQLLATIPVVILFPYDTADGSLSPCPVRYDLPTQEDDDETTDEESGSS